jgi:haloacetate dehalogenase
MPKIPGRHAGRSPSVHLPKCRGPPGAWTPQITVDVEHETADRQAGHRIAAPVLAMWQDPGDLLLPFDPEEVWSSWAPDLRTRVLPGGHFLAEDCPEEVAAAVTDLLAS